MKQENGRLNNAETAEVDVCSKDAKRMFCAVCDVYYDVLHAEFAETKCPVCNTILTDKVD